MIHEMELFQVGLRWLHFVFGITWIGLLWFFNWVNFPFQKELPADVKSKVNPKLLGRALWWFRHAAWLTVVVGILLFATYWDIGVYNEANSRAIQMGGALGVIMMLNVWFLIWPNQKRTFAAGAAGQSPDPKWAKTALTASRTNTILSFPMLFFMAAQSHFPSLSSWTNILVYLVVLAAVSWLVLWWVQMREKPASSGGPAATPMK